MIYEQGLSLRAQCDGAKPCNSCRSLRETCEYSGSDGRKKEDWKARVESLERRNRYLEEQVAQLSGQRPQPAQQPLQTVPETGPGSGQGHRNQNTNANDFHHLPDEDEMVHMFYAATADHPLLGQMGAQYGDHRRNRRDKLPDKRLTRYALYAFFQCAATIFYVTTEEQSTRLMERVYHSDDANMGDVCELSALAAIGSHYNINEVPDEARAAFFFLASTSLHEAMQSDYFQGMRIFICLCMSCVMDKSSNARLLIMSALNLARSRMKEQLQNSYPNNSGSEAYRRTLQTLVFLEGWLSYSLGYRNCLKQSEIDLVHSLWPPASQSSPMTPEAYTTRLIQSQMTRLSLLASGIKNEMVLFKDNYWAHADRLSLQLDLWHQDLPLQLRLAALNKPEKGVTALQERAIYIIHVLYINSRLQLYCQLFKASQSGTNGTGISMHQINHNPRLSLETLFKQIPKHICDVYTDFSIQLARIITLMFSSEAIITRCWIVIRSAFNSCIVLLLGVCQKYFTGTKTTDINNIFAHVESCLKVLRFCGRRDIAANRLGDLLDPVLRQLSHMSMGSSPSLHGTGEPGPSVSVSASGSGTRSGSGLTPGTGYTSGSGSRSLPPSRFGDTPGSTSSSGSGNVSSSNPSSGNERTPYPTVSGAVSGSGFGTRHSPRPYPVAGVSGLDMESSFSTNMREMTIQYILDKKASDLLMLVRMTHQILNLMPPDGCNVWV
ncbi:hypothetical protein BDW74DRAFT_67162 [Aspergillus multicolor]|uniref:fungal specific transcription factor domain-containing protein n=1 Tax=Aspergillus multicolor TaxID=41759 RepID=UPI003CCE4A16